MTFKKALTVFCGSSCGNNPVYAQEARKLGEQMAAQGRTLVYGSGRCGLMGEIARAVKENKGYAVGINIPLFSTPEFMMQVDENYTADTLLERKRLLIEKGDACIVLPGGIGTLDEMADVYSHLQLSLTDRPIGILNTLGYYNDFLSMINKMYDEGFLSRKYEKMFIVKDSVDELLKALDEA